MKFKFLLLTFLLLILRGLDFYSTSLWFFDDPTGEQNIFYRIFKVGWTGLIISNVIIVGFIIYCFYYYSYKYSIDKVSSRPSKLIDYISERYFNESGQFFKVFYKIPKNKKAFLGHIGYVLIRVAIIGSILATIHNLCQFYDASIYNSFREFVRRPSFVIYGLIFLSFIFFLYRLWYSEYKSAQKWFETYS